MYPKIFKSLALRSPVLGQIVKERDRLRDEVSNITMERDRLRHQQQALNSERNGNYCQQQESSSERNAGYCHCCRQEVIFEIQGSWLRDQYFCLSCSSIPRQRHTQHVLDSYFKGWEEKDIHESSPSNDFISRYCKSYSASQYFEGVEPGSMHAGVRCENLEELTFPDETFDIFITQDVFEHIFNPDLAAKEINRVLKPGGVHIFTAPKHKGISRSYPRARIVDNRIDYLMKEEYHGNPVGDGRALVTWDYGDDFEDLINSWSGATTTTYITRDRNIGIDAEYIEVFVTRKRENAA